MTTASPCRVIVLISGNGSNLQAMIDDAASRQNCPWQIVAVISNKAEAYGLQRAQAAGIKTEVVDHCQWPSREAFDQALMQCIDQYQPDLLVLAGFMRILTATFVQHYHGRILNIHPSLLPAYRGTRTHQRVLDAGESLHGVSVHFVTEELDGGPVVRQAVIRIEDDDTADSLATRVAKQEHRIYSEVINWFACGRLRMLPGRAELDGQILPDHGLRSGPDPK